jgi:hypothetical protein
MILIPTLALQWLAAQMALVKKVRAMLVTVTVTASANASARWSRPGGLNKARKQVLGGSKKLRG